MIPDLQSLNCAAMESKARGGVRTLEQDATKLSIGAVTQTETNASEAGAAASSRVLSGIINMANALKATLQKPLRALLYRKELPNLQTMPV